MRCHTARSMNSTDKLGTLIIRSRDNDNKKMRRISVSQCWNIPHPQERKKTIRKQKERETLSTERSRNATFNSLPNSSCKLCRTAGLHFSLDENSAGKKKKKETNVIGVRLRRSDYLPPIQLSASSEHRTDNLRPLPPISGESPTPKRVPRGYVDCPSSGS